MRRAWLLPLMVLTLVPSALWAQGPPIGPEFRVNTYTTGYQLRPSVASDAGGNFVVVWTGAGQGDPGSGIFAQRYAASGAPLGTEFRVNTSTTGTQSTPAVASAPSGVFVVVWQSESQDGSGYGVFGQRYASTGAPLGTAFRVNAYTSSDQMVPSVAFDGAGNFVAVWASLSQDGSDNGIFGQRYASTGAPAGPEFRVNTYTTNAQFHPWVAADSTGNFVVVWESYQDGSGYGVFGQRYASTGGPLGAAFRVNSYTTSYQTLPSVAAGASGFVVVWRSDGEDGSADGVFSQRYVASGAPSGPEFRVNTYTPYSQGSPSVAADAAGNFVVTWASTYQDGSYLGVFGQRYAGSGAAQGPEFRVNTQTSAGQGDPSVAATGASFVVTWSGASQDGSAYGIFGQRYSQIVPVELMHFRVE